MTTPPEPVTAQPSAAVPTTPEPIAPEPSETEPADPAPAVVEPAAPSYAEIYYLINQTCANIVCHVPGYYMPDLSDANDDQYDILMNTHIEQCGGVPLVDPGNPDGSAIMMVTHHQCGELAMPKDCTDPVCIPQQSVDALSAWIAAGASRD
jgi:hypothetical protein